MSSCSTATENIHNTPPPAYRSGSSSAATSDDEIGNFYPPSTSTYVPINTMPSRPASSEGVPAEEARSGVQWRYAEAGFSMLSLASQEAALPQPAANLIRQQYVAGVSCMLRGLPSELSADEELSLREALPDTLKLSLSTKGNTTITSSSAAAATHLSTTSSLNPQAPHHHRQQQQPLLHRLIATLTYSLFLLASFLLPYIQHLLREAYALDRKHKLSDRALAYGMTSADALGRQALVLAGNVCAMHDGRVGEAFKEAGVYVVRSFSGGVYDGLGEGMAKLGLRAGWSPSAAMGMGGAAGDGFGVQYGHNGHGHGKAPWVLQWQQR
jgi:hypothetical protein